MALEWGRAMSANDNHRLRWKALCLYRTEAGMVDVEHQFEEIADLHNLIERGPHWGTLMSCTITLNDPSYAWLTIEEASKQ
jgi:hypothetical protein